LNPTAFEFWRINHCRIIADRKQREQETLIDTLAGSIVGEPLNSTR